ncbi:XdhC family protein [Streptomyces sp. NBC_01390]|uniref:XdhC family protein n=1 Tax=Streptomyces sp. NBC_01390 TaxID=2903850 RepID=UPI003247F77F
MLDIAAELREWCEQGRDFAVATLVGIDGSAPRQPGASLAVDAAGHAVGSVSGGCVEGAVYEACRQALVTGTPELLEFGPRSDDPFAAHLTCGGVVELLTVPVLADTRRTVSAVLAAAVEGRGAALVRSVGTSGDLLGRPLLVHPDGSYQGSLGGPSALDRRTADEVRQVLADGVRVTRIVLEAPAGPGEAPAELFVEASVPPPRMLVFGAIDFAGAVSRVGRFLGFRVTVCDARPVFATPERFPDADEVVVDWPHRYLRSTDTDERTVICVLTHDPRFDIPLLTEALALNVAYVGAMGSRRTHEDRTARLRAHGLTDRELARLRSPIGLDLGARTPQETALSIAAEIVAVARGGTGVPLTGTSSAIHRPAPVPQPTAGSCADRARP